MGLCSPPRSWPTLAPLLFLASLLPIQGFNKMGALEVVYPTMVDPEFGNVTYAKYAQNRLVEVNSAGEPAAFTSQNSMDCMTSLGCYRAIGNVIVDSTIADPLQCFLNCVNREGQGYVVAGMSGENCACGVAIDNQWIKAPLESDCNFECTENFKSPLCGGSGDHWNLYMCYTHTHMGSLTIDPWRGLVFRSVSVNWFAEGQRVYQPDVVPETYFLFAADLTDGDAQPQFHLKQIQNVETELMIYTDIQYDVDSSRLVGMMLPAHLSRTVSELSFNYRLVEIGLNTMDPLRPSLEKLFSPMFSDPATKADIFLPGGSENVATEYYMSNINAAIISRNGIDSFVFLISSQMTDGLKSTVKSKVMFADISAPESFGLIYYNQPVDCVVIQLTVNEYYGDTGIMCSRNGNIEYVSVARVFRSSTTDNIVAEPLWGISDATMIHVAPVAETQKLHLLTGVVASNNMFNRTCHGIMLYSTTDGQTHSDFLKVLRFQPEVQDERSNAVPSVVCVDIRNQALTLWGGASGSAKTVENEVVSTALTMDLYQTDPGFPMTLPRAEMSRCEMTMTGLSVLVQFDSVTLQGATCVDTDFDGIPDYVDASTAVLTSTDAQECFSEASSEFLLGASCRFTQSDQMEVTLSELSTLSFGYTLCIKPNFVCREQNGQWGAYSTGCCTVDVPSNLVPPRPVLRADPSLVVDVCADVTLDFGDSQDCGRECSFNWALTSITSATAIGDANSPQSAFEAEKMDAVNALLAQANLAGSPLVTIEAAMLVKASFHIFNVEVTSFWGLSTTHEFSVQKLADSAPTVTIVGDQQVGVFQNLEYYLNAVGQASDCVNADTVLGYRWTYADCSVNLPDVPTVTNQNRLRMPPGYHRCPSNSGFIVDFFNRIACEVCDVNVEVYLINDPNKRSSQSLQVYVLKSDLVGQCYNPDNSLSTKGSTLYINCGNTQDPDDIHSGTFKGNYRWKCVSAASLLGCFSDVPEFTDSIRSCKTDYTLDRLVGHGGILYPQVAFEDGQSFCRVNRGTIAINTALMEIGTYHFTMETTHFDGLRQTSREFSVEITDTVLPRLYLEVVGDVKEKYPSSTEIRVRGQHNLDPEKYPDIRYDWKILERQRNLEYDANQAEQYRIEGRTYPVPEFVYQQTVPALLPSCQALGKAAFASNSPTITMGPDCLTMNTDYSLRLAMSWTVLLETNQELLTTYADMRLATASGPPTNGKFLVSILSPAGLLTTDTNCAFEREFSAEDWISVDTPLKYRFGYIVDSSLTYNEQTATTSNVAFLINDAIKYWFTDAPQPVRTQRGLVQCGTSANGYKRLVFVYVETSAGEYVYKFREIVASPPPDPLGAAQSILDTAGGQAASNPELSISLYMAALGTVQEGTPEEISATEGLILDSLSASACQSTECADRQLVFLNNMADATGTLSENLEQTLVNSLEDSVSQISNAPAAVSDSQGQSIFSSMSILFGSSKFELAGGRLRRLSPSPSSGGFFLSTPSRRRLSESELSQPSDSTDVLQGNACSIGQCSKRAAQFKAKCLKSYGDGSRHKVMVCCEEMNPTTNCYQSPCWFYGTSCQRATETVHRVLADLVSSDMSSRPPSVPSYRLISHYSYEPWWEHWADRYMKPANELALNWYNMSDFERERAWAAYAGGSEEAASFSFEANKFEHEKNFKHDDRRRLEGVSLPFNQSQGYHEFLTAIEAVEREPWMVSKDMVKAREEEADEKRQADLKWEMYVSTLSPAVQSVMRTRKREVEEAQATLEYQAERNVSQLITRITVARDTLIKKMVRQLVSNEEPKEFDTPNFKIYIGKTTNMSRVHPAFVFPSQYIVPSSSPDNPTPDNPVTGFSFEYVEYRSNIYSWSDSAPPSGQDTMVTLIVMKANPDLSLVTSREDDPILIYADRDIYSSGLCLFWDRFIPNTAGGAWTRQGNLNDGKGCLITQFGDIGLYIDGAMPDVEELAVAADIPFKPRPPTANRYLSVAIMGCLLGLNLVLTIWGYKFDETRREDMRKGMAATKPFYLDGDGVTGALTTADPIAYQHANNKKKRIQFVLVTYWNVLVQEHALLGPVFYNENFTRPQRLLCFSVLLTGLMAINALVYGTPNTLASSDQSAASGVLSALLTFPVYSLIQLMFSQRPTPSRQKLVKKKLKAQDRDKIAEAIRLQERDSSKIPTSGPVGPQAGKATSPHRPLIGGPPALPPVSSQSPTQLPVGGLMALENVPGAPAPPTAPPPQTMLPPIFFSGRNEARPGLPMLPGAEGPVVPPPSMPPPLMAGITPPQSSRGMAPPGMPPIGGARTPPGGVTPPMTPGRSGRRTPPSLKRNIPAPATPGNMTPQGPSTPRGPINPPPRRLSRASEAPATPKGPPPRRSPSNLSEAPATPKGPPPKRSASNISAKSGGGSKAKASLPSQPATPKGAPPRVNEEPEIKHQMMPPTPPDPAEMQLALATLAPSGAPTVIPANPAAMAMVPVGQAPSNIPAPAGAPPTALAPAGPYPKAGGSGAVPPAPPNEDAGAFVRRVRLVYLDKVQHQHEKEQLLEERAVGTPIPEWVYTATTILPYLACLAWSTVGVFIVLMYSLKFDVTTEKRWYSACGVGLLVSLLFLDAMKAGVFMIVEIRKFEIRRRTKHGEFNQRRIKKEGDEKAGMANEKPGKRLPKTAAIPKPGNFTPVGGRTPAMGTPIMSRKPSNRALPSGPALAPLGYKTPSRRATPTGGTPREALGSARSGGLLPGRLDGPPLPPMHADTFGSRRSITGATPGGGTPRMNLPPVASGKVGGLMPGSFDASRLGSVHSLTGSLRDSMKPAPGGPLPPKPPSGATTPKRGMSGSRTPPEGSFPGAGGPRPPSMPPSRKGSSGSQRAGERRNIQG